MADDNQTATPTATPVASAEDVAEVLLDQVDETIGKIEQEKETLAPLERALEIAEADLERVQEAGLATEKPDLVQVYERAETVAKQIVEETRLLAETHAKKITVLQASLKTILDELKKMDPENPLVQQL